MAFGDKATNPEKTRLLWDKFKHVPDGMFTVGIDNIILTQRQSPTLEDFIKNLFEAKKLVAPQKKPPLDEPLCAGCNGSAFTDEDRSLMLKTTQERISGRISDFEWNNFKTNIQLQVDAHIKTHVR